MVQKFLQRRINGFDVDTLRSFTCITQTLSSKAPHFSRFIGDSVGASDSQTLRGSYFPFLTSCVTIALAETGIGTSDVS